MTEQVIEFNVNDARIAEIKEQCKEIDAYKDIDAAKAAKKTLVKMRTTLGEAHKEQKAESLAIGRRLDAEKNRLLALIGEIEDPIGDQLNEIKNAAAAAEAERLAGIEAAIFQIDALAQDRHELDLGQLTDRQKTLRAIEVTEEVFQEQTESAETHYADVEMKLRIAIDAEKTRLEEEKEQARIAEANRIEQERLAQEREDFEREKAEAKAKQDAKDEEDRLAQKAIDDEAKRVEDERLANEREDLAKQQKAIDEENERLQKIADEKEAQRLAEEEEQRKAEQAPDIDKLIAFADLIDSTAVPSLQSQQAKRILTLAMEKIEPATQYIRNEARKMK